MKLRPTGFAAPLGQASSGSLVFLSGASGINLLADPQIPDLARCYFAGPAPHVESGEGTLVVQFHRFSRIDGQVLGREKRGEIRLNASIPWEIEFHGPLAGLDADLRGLQLRSIDVLGDASDVRLLLSRPAGAGFIYVSGDIRKVSIRRPPETGVCLSAFEGVFDLSLDGLYFSALRSEPRLETPGFADSPDRYEVSISGSARGLTIDKQG